MTPLFFFTSFFLFLLLVQSARQKKVPAGGGGGGGSGAVRGESFTGGWTKGLLLVENSVSHQEVTLLHTD
jgi:hypothetical protein